MTPKRRLLQIPPGTEAFFLEEAFRHRRILAEIDRIFTGWGYLPAETPVFDFYDIYQPLLGESGTGKAYRLMDRDGDLLLLRSDVTLFLAKQLGMALTVEDLPVRVWYADSILRHQESNDISKNEFYQVGAEIVGVPGISGDGEILLMVAEILSFLKVDAVLHIGSAGLVHKAAEGMDEEETEEFFKAVALRDKKTIETLLPESDPSRKQLLLDLFAFIGSPEEYREFLAPLRAKLPADYIELLDHLQNLTELLNCCSAASSIRVDFSETGSQAYHTGIVFQAYLEGIDSAFISGGRYDKLLENFGFESPSVGFSLLLRKIEPLIGEAERFSLPAATENAKGASLKEKYQDALTKRAAGRIVRL